jgi:hypothetical protein
MPKIVNIKAAPLRGAAGASVAGLCVGTPARHGRAEAGQQAQINPAHSGGTDDAARGRLPRPGLLLGGLVRQPPTAKPPVA